MLHHAVLKHDYLYASIGKTEGGYVGSTPSLSPPQKNQKKNKLKQQQQQQ